MKIIKTEGIILKKKEINEADVIITIFTKNFGKIDSIIHGIRKSKRREKNVINAMNVSEISMYQKNSYYTIKDMELKKTFLEISKDIEKLEVGFYFLDTINKIYEYNDVDEEFYDRIVNIFDYLDRKEITNSAEKYIMVTHFLRRIMIEQGIYEESDIMTYFSKDLLEIYKLIESKSKIKERVGNELSKIALILEKVINEELQTKLNLKKFIIGEI